MTLGTTQAAPTLAGSSLHLHTFQVQVSPQIPAGLQPTGGSPKVLLEPQATQASPALFPGAAEGPSALPTSPSHTHSPALD